MQNHTEELFAGSAPAVVTSERVLYTPSGFARTSLGYLQEIGTLKVPRPHTAGRKNLTSFLFFTVTEGCGELTYEGKTYVLKRATAFLLTVGRNTSKAPAGSCGVWPGSIFMDPI